MGKGSEEKAEARNRKKEHGAGGPSDPTGVRKEASAQKKMLFRTKERIRTCESRTFVQQ